MIGLRHCCSLPSRRTPLPLPQVFMKFGKWKWRAVSSLKGDGHFRYALSYGAVDEECEGGWTFDGKTVWLTSKPMPKAPSFELVRDDPAPKGELFMTLEDPGFEWGHPARSDRSELDQTWLRDLRQ